MSRRRWSDGERDYWHELRRDREMFGQPASPYDPYVVADVAGESGPKPVPTPEEQLAIVKALPVEATVAAMEDGRSPTPDMSPNAVRRQLTALFGDKVRHVSQPIHSREEDR